MKLSIITTVYKAENDLPRLLESMMAQKSPELEFFLIDNGSPDRCGEICREYAEKDPRFTIYTLEENIGYIRARNLGIEVCDGDYIGFCDSDDYLEPGGYDRAVEKLRETECDFYIGSFYRHEASRKELYQPPFPEGTYSGPAVAGELMPQLFGSIHGKLPLYGFAWKHIYRRSIITAHGISFWEPMKPCEDQLFNIDAMRCCGCVCVEDNVLYNYIVHESSISAQMQNQYRVEDDWKRTTMMFSEKYRRAEAPLEKEAACNGGMYGIYAIALNLTKRSAGKLGEAVNTLQQYCHAPLVDAMISGASPKQSKQMTFVRWCLRHRQYRLMMTAISVALKLRRS